MGVSIWEGSKAQELIDAIKNTEKVDKQQGTANAGKALVVGSDGLVGFGDAGISEEAKQALLTCFRHVAFMDSADDYYNNLREALYPSAPIAEIFWDYTMGRLPSTEDGIEFTKANDYTVTLDPNNGMHVVCTTPQDWGVYANFVPVDYPLVKEAILEATVKIVSGGSTFGCHLRLGDGTTYAILRMNRYDESSTGIKFNYQITQNGQTETVILMPIEFNREYNLKLHFKENGTTIGYLDNNVLFNITNQATGNFNSKIGVIGMVDMYIKSMNFKIIDA